ncbi:Ras-specific guanine nucleotide-releasing factor RalGPS1 [Pteropus alecto]|uniref:Ras-specific guanine nucleotide-releasing factor RalGPS1 n=1 Tax=Pteropus alecto TaxID=9402 RepID=L5K673_PTEAL|nr:Ras-specific guanine nucleotide-releasing factor RalGPS1 [Pteropus alecto]
MRAEPFPRPGISFELRKCSRCRHLHLHLPRPQLREADHLTTLPHVQKYLKSVRYIEELQKFVEDDNYNCAEGRLRPGVPPKAVPSSAQKRRIQASFWKDSREETEGECGGLGEPEGPSAGSSSARFSRRPTCPDASVAGSLPTPPVPRHRKSHSLGNNMMCQLSVVESKSATFPSERARHLLDDSVLESRSPRRGLAPTSPSAVTNGLSLGSSESSEFSEEMSSGLESPTGPCICALGGSAAVPTMEGPLRRKTLLKEGRKPAYKSTPGKKVSVVGWMVQLPDDPEHPDIFQLNNPDKGNVYKFQTGSRFHAILWHKHLDDACKSNRPQFTVAAVPTLLGTPRWLHCSRCAHVCRDLQVPGSLHPMPRPAVLSSLSQEGQL